MEIRGDSHQDLIAGLVDLASEIHYTVTIGQTGRADGSCNTKTKRILLAEHLEANARLTTLIHELAHALVAEHPDAPKLGYAQGELIAESIAFCCAQTVGLDTSTNSIPYLASWAQNTSLAVLEQTAAMTGRLSDRIEAALRTDSTVSAPGEQPPIDPALVAG